MAVNVNKSNAEFLIWGSDWFGHPTSAIHLARQLIRNGFKVIWINSIGMRSPVFKSEDVKRILFKLFEFMISLFKADRTISPKLPAEEGEEPTTLINPLLLPFYGKPFIRKLNKVMVKWQLLRVKKKVGGRVITITCFPNSADNIDQFDPVLKIYYVMDDFSTLPGVDHKDMMVYEKELLQNIDGIIFSEESFMRDFNRQNVRKVRSRFISHGVDVDHFKSSRNNMPVPAELLGCSNPLIGFVGLIDERINLKLIRKIADTYRAASIVLIGKAKVDTSILNGAENIWLLGPVDYRLIPRYLKCFDVCIIPYVRDKSTVSLNPLKLKEYIISGKQVVATSIPALNRFRQIVYLAENDEQFLDQLSDALRNRQMDSTMINKICADESWNHKANELIEFCDDLLQAISKKISDT